ncbi:MAG: ATP-binding protein [Rickettsiales bacterium]|jgi:predicted AAA+ superfamily ATPase|nr:ATP-binding protein [Rickettsiales bacterium]
MIKRDVFEKINKSLFQNKVILIFGTRRVGKTTLLLQIIAAHEALGKKCAYLNCDLLSIKQALETTNEQLLRQYTDGFDIIAIDEAQNVVNIGHTLKIMHDVFPKVQVIATGSSSFDLANKTGEPLVGRSRMFVLYPFSINELQNTDGAFKVSANLENFLRYGMYPCIYGMTEANTQDELENLVNGYLYKDILAFENIKHSDQILKLLQCLALQIGSEVSFNELATKLTISTNTVKRYVDLLEKCYVIFTLPAFSRNLRNEISSNRTRKIFFYDVGIRNALLGNYQSIHIRNDVGGIWENFCIEECLKKAQKESKKNKIYFWRNYSGREVDFIEERNGELYAYEFKYILNKKVKLPKEFSNTYNITDFKVIHKNNWMEYFF